ncbi:hypothetical protein [Nonomuraea basaltis]|uniref:hypothetical protein n=1 Tax=Nonomuraea basaltis TaxID=2495887 RepID=UPI00110C502B|nr:hypothetical protein [Nonomuraea basaltis]TMR98047.1 hypothetical protein EJK15_14580 [Nonomuraea basaltis]
MPSEGRAAGSPAEGDAHLTGRQLDVLRTTYPAWEIHYLVDAPDAARWTAELRRPITVRMSAAGIRQRIGSPDAVTLASTLAHQASLIHNERVEAWPG